MAGSGQLDLAIGVVPGARDEMAMPPTAPRAVAGCTPTRHTPEPAEGPSAARFYPAGSTGSTGSINSGPLLRALLTLGLTGSAVIASAR